MTNLKIKPKFIDKIFHKNIELNDDDYIKLYELITSYELFSIREDNFESSIYKIRFHYFGIIEKQRCVNAEDRAQMKNVLEKIFIKIEENTFDIFHDIHVKKSYFENQKIDQFTQNPEKKIQLISELISNKIPDFKEKLSKIINEIIQRNANNFLFSAYDDNTIQRNP